MPRTPDIIRLMDKYREERKQRMDELYQMLKEKGPRALCSRVDNLERAIAQSLKLLEQGKTAQALSRLQKTIASKEDKED